MICGNCGFQNASTDEFCGSCGQFLAWTGTPADETRAAAAAGSLGCRTAAAWESGRNTRRSAAAAARNRASAPSAATAAAPPPPADPGIQWPAGLQRCDVCGTANELNRTFCMNCGSQLKRAGTVGGYTAAAARASKPTNWRPLLYLVGGLVILLVFAGIAFVAFGGLGALGPRGTGSPSASLVAGTPSAGPSLNPSASAGPSESLPPATLTPTFGPPASVEPPTPSPPAPSEEPPATPTTTLPPATSPPATAPPAGEFVCAASSFNAAQPGGWQIFQAHWSRRGPADTLFLEMRPASSGSTATVQANILPPDQVESTYGVPGPASGDVAVVLAFNDAVTVTGPFQAPVGYRVLQEFSVSRKNGLVYVVIGVNGSGCYNLSADAWTSGSATSPELAVALQR